MEESSVYLTRHGARIDTEDPSWLKKCLHNRADDPHLSAAGRTSAVELARALSRSRKSGAWQLRHIVSSPYTRCVETAHVVAEAVNVTVKIEPGIAEVNSTPNPGFLDACELREQFPLIDTSYSPVMTRQDLSVEHSDGACAQRSAATALQVRENLAGSILFVGHGASCLGIAGAFGQQGYVGYSSLTHFVRINGEWELDGVLGDVSHLSDKRTSLDSAW
eukprot:CCRYP_019418-RA/>CCRYP_019418-RA protein AED:0.44 eAED:0.44 QI:0/-1/0/1/-1/1/1/0/219